MAKRIALMIGTRKGAFLVFSDESRRSWDLKGPFFKGVEVNHVGCLPRANVVTATLKSAWWDPGILLSRGGCVVGRNCSPSDDGGHNWQEVRGLNDRRRTTSGCPGAGGLMVSPSHGRANWRLGDS
jgi:hypothetical protein